MKKFCFAITLIIGFLCVSVRASSFDGQSALNELYDAAPDSVVEQMPASELTEQSITDVLTLESIIDLLSSQFMSTLSEDMGVMVSVIGILILMGIYDSLRDS
jgi:hypothetical protein